MTFPWKYYESDVHKLLGDLMREKPEIAESKKLGQSLWWERKLGSDELKRVQEAEVPQQPYVYQTKV